MVSALDDLGAIPTANASREQLLLSIDVLRNSLPEAMELFADTVLRPRFGGWGRPPSSTRCCATSCHSE